MSIDFFGKYTDFFTKNGVDLIAVNKIFEASKIFATIRDIKLDRFNADTYASALLADLDIIIEQLVIANKIYNDVKNLRKEQAGLAHLERAASYLNSRGQKETEGNKSAYVAIDPKHMECQNIESAAEAYLKFLDLKHEQFVMAHYYCRGVYKADQTINNIENDRS